MSFFFIFEMERQGFVSFIEDEDDDFQPKGVFKIFEHRTAAVDPSQFSEKIEQELTRADAEEKAALQAQKEALFLEALRTSQIEGEEDEYERQSRNYLSLDPSSELDISISPRFDQLLSEIKPDENKTKSINNLNLNNVPNLRSNEEDHTEHKHGRFKSEIEKWLFDLENLESELKPVIEEEREWIEKTEQRQIKVDEYSRELQYSLNERLKANREQAEKDFKDFQASKEKILVRQERQRKKTIKQLSKDTSKLQKENELTSRKLQKTFTKLRTKVQMQKNDNLFLSLSQSVGDFDFGSGATSLVTSTYASSSSEDEYFSASDEEHEDEK